MKPFSETAADVSAGSTSAGSTAPAVLLVGAGVVGTAIARAHAVRQVPFVLADQCENALADAASSLREFGVDPHPAEIPVDGLKAFCSTKPVSGEASPPRLVIESIVEKVEPKQSLFESLQRAFGDQAVLCSNTSTLRIEQIAGSRLSFPGMVCGMHFFMPVHLRAATEIVAGPVSDPKAIDAAVAHCNRLGKRAIRCQDGPGFIVNRMLSPYLNQALLLLCRGATVDQLRRVALAFGMPMSPLELIDWIGAPTMFHAGRAFCNAFPNRLDPSPVVPALVKRNRFGRVTGKGLFDYQDGRPEAGLAAEAEQLIAAYQTRVETFSDADVLFLLSIPMWIEATKILEEGIADSMDTIDLAMAGGLGYNSETSWSQFFAELGQDTIDAAIQRWQSEFRSMRWS